LTNDRYYKQGYDEGFEDGIKSGPEEGFDFGHQVAFQKFLPLGVILGRCEIWKQSLRLSDDSSNSVKLSTQKKKRALKNIEQLEIMILGLDRYNESEAEGGKFEEMKNKIINKTRVVESLVGEERISKRDLSNESKEEDDISLAKRLDRELQL